jgi:hypothetical protein
MNCSRMEGGDSRLRVNLLQPLSELFCEHHVGLLGPGVPYFIIPFSSVEVVKIKLDAYRTEAILSLGSGTHIYNHQILGIPE